MALDVLTRQLVSVPQDISRASGSNFARAFFFLKVDERRAIEAVYAFARVLDDAVDEWQDPEDKRRALAFWRGHFAAMEQGAPHGPLLGELAWAIDRFVLPVRPFYELMRGCETDIDKNRYDSFAELEAYCYDVAGTVGLVSLPIFGIYEPQAQGPGIALGKALQLTNILRDVDEDLTRDRVYLPLEDMARFGYTLPELERRTYNEAFYRLMCFEADRASLYFDEAWKFLQNAKNRRYLAPWLMGKTYHAILERLRRRRFQVFGRKEALPRRKKLALAGEALWRLALAAVRA
jgi:phytoene synthase